MYSSDQLKRGISNPNLILRELNSLFYNKARTEEFNPRGLNIFGEDWDNLIILDACRYDMFQEISDFKGTLSKATSQGSDTVEFLRANFRGKDLRDTVYVTANPQYYRHRQEINANLHEVINIWQEEGWNDKYSTVLPETTTEYATKAAEQYPNKRLIAHYIQPHYPFIDSDTDFDKGQLEDPNAPDSFWQQIMHGKLEISTNRIWKAYKENLQRAIPHVDELVNSLKGKTVITSDHGNMVGERSYPIPIREWGHPRGQYTKELVSVPWLVQESSSRRQIISEDSNTERKESDKDIVADRLKQLGYAE